MGAALEQGRRSMYLIVLDDSPYRDFYAKLGGRQLARRTATKSHEAHAVYGWREYQASVTQVTGTAPLDAEPQSRTA